MIDRPSRDAAAGLIGDYYAGRITNDELQDGWPRSKVQDDGLRAAYWFMWQLYSDMEEHRIRPEDAQHPEVRRRIELFIAFLLSARPYEYPLMPGGTRTPLVPHWAVVATLGAGALWNRIAQWSNQRKDDAWNARMEAAGDFAVWPFARRDDADAALSNVADAPAAGGRLEDGSGPPSDPPASRSA